MLFVEKSDYKKAKENDACVNRFFSELATKERKNQPRFPPALSHSNAVSAGGNRG